ncbi:MAG: iron dependent repressor [Deltaproteobacteria bacterium]|nr:iron dependent repressor [Deltaproteobacteria bacterium]
MNHTPSSPPRGQGRYGQGWLDSKGRNETQVREEVLELLWTLREAGKNRLDEILKSSTEEDLEEILGAMERDGWIGVQNGEVTFQEGGERRALEVIRRHRLAERLLSEVFELEETDFETSACQFEHILSPQVLESVCTFLGHPPVCPHGKAIPPGPCCARFKREVEPLVRPLPDLKLGEQGRVVFITPKSKGRLERLSSLGLTPGSVVRLEQKRPSYVIEIGETTLALDEEIAKEIYVKRV